ncbi:unnamed protein product [Clavelina lepadiformis]|uniref:Steroid 5-alpha reductase C-terminal domain-containing protein n=1 Tax=Clavelina lepadiformis TaxID=159417 RepID=A0ABP0FWD6_CLALP
MHNLLSALLVDFFIQIVGFSLAITLQTEKFYDFAGSFTFILLAQLSLRWNVRQSFRQVLVTSMVTIWALRLGGFLFYRVLLAGGDHRFDKVKTKPVTFFIYWMIQGVWVYVTVLPTLLLNNKKNYSQLSLQDYLGIAVWLTGFLIEVVADWQKMAFRNNPDNTGKFISSGLWSISRHPNYFGEIVMWVGIFLVASTVFTGWEWLSIFSPMFVYYLLTNVSGIPILERSSMKRYGSLGSYKEYINNVPVLVPFIGSP